MRNASAIFMSGTEAITCLLQILTLRSYEERVGVVNKEWAIKGVQR